MLEQKTVNEKTKFKKQGILKQQKQKSKKRRKK